MNQSIRPLCTDNVPSVYRCTNSQSYNYARAVNDQKQQQQKLWQLNENLGRIGLIFLSVAERFLLAGSSSADNVYTYAVCVPLMASY